MGIFKDSYFGTSRVVKKKKLVTRAKERHFELREEALENVSAKKKKSEGKRKAKKKSGSKRLISRPKKVPKSFKPFKKPRGKSIGKPKARFEL